MLRRILWLLCVCSPPCGRGTSHSALQPVAPTHIECYAVQEPCACNSGDRCANASTAPGLRNRGDADHCCCSAMAPLVWKNPPALCMEVKKCTYDCCADGLKLCGSSCCQVGEKCIKDVCSSVPTTTVTTPAPMNCGSYDWWEIIHGNKVLSAILEFVVLPSLFCVGGTQLRPALRRLQALPCVARRLPALAAPRPRQMIQYADQDF